MAINHTTRFFVPSFTWLFGLAISVQILQKDWSQGSHVSAFSASRHALDSAPPPECDPGRCQLPDCFCSLIAGAGIPGDMDPTLVPQMVTVTFNGAIDSDGIGLFRAIFSRGRRNPNGCQVKGTFYVFREQQRDFSGIHELYRKGHEIGVLASPDDNHRPNNNTLTYPEIGRERHDLEHLANMKSGSVKGARAPLSTARGDTLFDFLEKQDFQYDTSIMAPLEEVPIWPYSLQFHIPHYCRDDVQRCPEKSHKLWEMVLNELDTGDDDQCSFMFDNECSAMADPKRFARALRRNLEKHFLTNRAPLGLNFHVNFFEQNKGLLAELTDFMDEAIDQYGVYFVTMQQVLQWIQNPTELNNVEEFQQWKDKCVVEE